MRVISYVWVILITLTPFLLHAKATEHKNVINRFGTPALHQDFDQYRNQRFNPLFDLGAWHGFLLPDAPEHYGAFTGPMIIAEEYGVFVAEKLE